MLNRRDLILGSAYATAALATSAALAPAAVAAGLRINEDLSRAAFESRVGYTFYTRNPATFRLVVMDLVELVDAGDDANVEQFSILLRCAAGTEMPEGQHLLWNPGCLLRLHLAPVGEDANGTYCSATFAHLL